MKRLLLPVTVNYEKPLRTKRQYTQNSLPTCNQVASIWETQKPALLFPSPPNSPSLSHSVLQPGDFR